MLRMIVRDLSGDDLDAALAMNNANVPALNELDAPELRRLVELATVALAAEADGRLAGFCLVIGPAADYASLNYRWFSRRHAHFAYLDRIAVEPAQRRAGVGRSFYGELVARLTGRFPVLCCEVNVRPRNHASIAFHAAVGFHEVGQQDTDGGRKTVSLLELDLGPPYA